MIRITVCDDEVKELNKTIALCHQYIARHTEYEARITAFSSHGELLENFTKHEDYDIVLLDIYMPGMTGIKLAHCLRESGSECQIVFLTTSLTHAVEAFSLHAAHYLVKPFTEEQLEDALSKAISMCENSRKDHIILKTSAGVQKINYSDYIYSETDKHVQRLHLAGENSIQVRIACSELAELLSQDKRFFKCGSTYIINMDKIEEVTAQYILFEEGVKIPMQRRQYKELLNRYTGYSLEGK
jgi:DNA-binding LytR/AlgR family response regulator